MPQKVHRSLGELHADLDAWITEYKRASQTDLSMSLKRTGFADWDAIPWGALGSGVRVQGDDMERTARLKIHGPSGRR